MDKTQLNELSAQLLANYRAKAKAQAMSADSDANKEFDKKSSSDVNSKSFNKGIEHLKDRNKRASGYERASEKWKGKAESERAGTLDKAKGYTPEASLKTKLKSALGRMSDAEKAKDQKQREQIGAQKAKEALADRNKVKSLSQKANASKSTPEDIESHRKARTELAKKQLKNISVSDKVKSVAKKGLSAAMDKAKSLKSKIFGEGYYDNLDYKESVIPLVEALLEGNSSDIERAFEAAISERIEYALEKARIAIAEEISELDEARGMIDMGDGDVRRPATPKERKEVAKALVTARKYNRSARDFEAKHPDDDKSSQESRMKELNYKAKGSASGTVIAKGESGEKERGVKMPNVDNPTRPKEARAAVWRDDSKDKGANSHLKKTSPIRANQGKASWKKERPEMPD